MSKGDTTGELPEGPYGSRLLKVSNKTVIVGNFLPWEYYGKPKVFSERVSNEKEEKRNTPY